MLVLSPLLLPLRYPAQPFSSPMVHATKDESPPSPQRPVGGGSQGPSLGMYKSNSPPPKKNISLTRDHLGAAYVPAAPAADDLASTLDRLSLGSPGTPTECSAASTRRQAPFNITVHASSSIISIYNGQLHADAGTQTTGTQSRRRRGAPSAHTSHARAPSPAATAPPAVPLVVQTGSGGSSAHVPIPQGVPARPVSPPARVGLGVFVSSPSSPRLVSAPSTSSSSVVGGDDPSFDGEDEGNEEPQPEPEPGECSACRIHIREANVFWFQWSSSPRPTMTTTGGGMLWLRGFVTGYGLPGPTWRGMSPGSVAACTSPSTPARRQTLTTTPTVKREPCGACTNEHGGSVVTVMLSSA